MIGFTGALNGVKTVNVMANNQLTLEGKLDYSDYRVVIKPTGNGPSSCPTNGCYFSNSACPQSTSPKSTTSTTKTICRFENDYLRNVNTIVSFKNSTGWYPGNY